jgi:hypothetical protein
VLVLFASPEYFVACGVNSPLVHEAKAFVDEGVIGEINTVRTEGTGTSA